MASTSSWLRKAVSDGKTSDRERLPRQKRPRNENAWASDEDTGREHSVKSALTHSFCVKCVQQKSRDLRGLHEKKV